MSEKENKPTENKENKSNSSKIVIPLVLVAVIAVGALAYFSGTITGDKLVGENPAPAGEVEEEQVVLTAPPVPPQAAPLEIRPGNPVVAKLDGKDINRLDVLNYIQTLPPETQQLPVGQLFPLAVEQVINANIISEKVKNVALDDDPLVKKNLARAKEQILRTVFLQKEVEKAMTEDRLKEAYDAYKKGFDQPEEAHAKHILVDDEALAKELIKKLDDGADFAELVKENSKDKVSAARGGDVGYFTRGTVVPEFADAAFSMEKGSYTKEPVKSQFGYHIIKLEDKRTRPVPGFEESKPFLQSELRGALLNKIVQDWRGEAKVERFDINGDAIKAAGQEPASGE